MTEQNQDAAEEKETAWQRFKFLFFIFPLAVVVLFWIVIARRSAFKSITKEHNQ